MKINIDTSLQALSSICKLRANDFGNDLMPMVKRIDAVKSTCNLKAFEQGLSSMEARKIIDETPQQTKKSKTLCGNKPES
jgi:hypothetical protein